MKFRIDFVTNSSSESFIYFNVKNTKLFEYLQSLGLRIQSAEEGVFNKEMSVTLPSGVTGWLDEEESIYPFYDTSSISEWLMKTIEEYVWENPLDELDDDFDEWQEYWKTNRKELSRILTKNVMKRIIEMDGYIEHADIVLEDGFEGTIYTCQEITIDNGIRVDTTPEETHRYGVKLEKDFNFKGDPGKVITQKWENGHWSAI